MKPMHSKLLGLEGGRRKGLRGFPFLLILSGIVALLKLYFVSQLPRLFTKAWFPYRCICRICRVCRTKKINRTDITLWKPPVQMLNTKETTYTTFCTR